MTKPRAHAYMAKLYFSDSEMGCWMWNEREKAWKPDYDPSFNHRFIYHVGEEAPTEPPPAMCELAGVKFPMPVQIDLEKGQDYCIPNPRRPDEPAYDTWDGKAVDRRNRQANMVQLTREGAIQQARAMVAALEQAIGKAKEQIK